MIAEHPAADIALGAPYAITLVSCPDCDGSGWDDMTDMRSPQPRWSDRGGIVRVPCAGCGGNGRHEVRVIANSWHSYATGYVGGWFVLRRPAGGYRDDLRDAMIGWTDDKRAAIEGVTRDSWTPDRRDAEQLAAMGVLWHEAP